MDHQSICNFLGCDLLLKPLSSAGPASLNVNNVCWLDFVHFGSAPGFVLYFLWSDCGTAWSRRRPSNWGFFYSVKTTLIICLFSTAKQLDTCCVSCSSLHQKVSNSISIYSSGVNRRTREGREGRDGRSSLSHTSIFGSGVARRTKSN